MAAILKQFIILFSMVLVSSVFALDYTKPLMECRSQSCSENLKRDCQMENGVVQFYPTGPAMGVQVCFLKAPDAKKNCASDEECLSKICDFESAIQSKACSLVKKRYQDKAHDYYTAIYSCNTTKPGHCAATPSNVSGAGLGYDEEYILKDKQLIKIRKPGVMF